MTAPLTLDEDGLLTCRRCGERAPLDRFAKSNRGALRVIAVCKPCINAAARAKAAAEPERYAEYWRRSRARESVQETQRQSRRERRARDRAETARRDHADSIKRRYGLTSDEYEQLLVKQGGVCAICRSTDRGHRRLNVDHCHATGAVRGLLCGQCNAMLGLAKEDPSVLQAGIDYLARVTSN